MAVHNDTLLTVGGDNRVLAWDLKTFEKAGEVCLEEYINDIAVASGPGPGVIYVAGQNKCITALTLS